MISEFWRGWCGGISGRQDFRCLAEETEPQTTCWMEGIVLEEEDRDIGNRNTKSLRIPISTNSKSPIPPPKNTMKCSKSIKNDIGILVWLVRGIRGWQDFRCLAEETEPQTTCWMEGIVLEEEDRDIGNRKAGRQDFRCLAEETEPQTTCWMEGIVLEEEDRDIGNRNPKFLRIPISTNSQALVPPIRITMKCSKRMKNDIGILAWLVRGISGRQDFRCLAEETEPQTTCRMEGIVLEEEDRDIGNRRVGRQDFRCLAEEIELQTTCRMEGIVLEEEDRDIGNRNAVAA